MQKDHHSAKICTPRTAIAVAMVKGEHLQTLTPKLTRIGVSRYASLCACVSDQYSFGSILGELKDLILLNTDYGTSLLKKSPFFSIRGLTCAFKKGSATEAIQIFSL